MRISEDRYSREQWGLELALRFLRHEARTQTIRIWTGLTDDRIRNLYRSYLQPSGQAPPRHRGKSPHQVAYFIRSSRLQWESAQLASMYYLLGVIPSQPSRETALNLPGLSRGEKLCYAFESYRQTIPDAHIAFEHAVFLATALARGDQLRPGSCLDCGGLLILEWFPKCERRCCYCSSQDKTGPSPSGRN